MINDIIYKCIHIVHFYIYIYNLYKESYVDTYIIIYNIYYVYTIKSKFTWQVKLCSLHAQ